MMLYKDIYPQMLSWSSFLIQEQKKPYFSKILKFLDEEKILEYTVFPPLDYIYTALEHCSFAETKVIILGQDPYHGAGQAMGMSFSVPAYIRKPPSLTNIYKELALEYPGYDVEQSGDLTRRAKQGVLLLNTSLTVRAATPGSHRYIGWEIFTDEIISMLSVQKSGLVFLLRGNDAISKSFLIDTSKHLILTAPHPSPLSAYRGWFGCGHFKKTNQWLEERGIQTIYW